MTQTTITRKIEIDMGHRVPNHKTKCKNLHGHRYVFEVALCGIPSTQAQSSDEGMVFDFGDLKAVLTKVIHDPFDHGLMLFEDDPIATVLLQAPECEGQKIVLVPFIPTAENIVRYVYEALEKEFKVYKDIALHYVKVWETPNATACYMPQ